METIAVFNRENVPAGDIKDFRHRRAVRGVIFDDNNNIALLHAVVQGYYGLPGGGVDSGEDFKQGIVRECREEIGCNISITSELGRTIEYRKGDSLLNETYGYLGKVVGEKGKPIFVGDENEAEKNSVIVWTSLDKAIELMENTPVQEKLYSQYCIERDLVFLRKAKEF